jgi:hypothetical protein
MSDAMVISLIPVISVIVLLLAVAVDIYTNPHYVAERAHKRNQQVWMQRPKKTYWAAKTARNLGRHRNIY